MSLTFNDTSTFRGLVQVYEDEIGADRGFVSDNADRLKQFAAAVNLAWDDYLAIAIPASGRWQYDDSNHEDLPFMKTNLVAGQREYNFNEDEGGNLVLDIHKVAILAEGGARYEEIHPIDQQSDDARGLVSEDTTQGIPNSYDKTGNSIFLDPAPSYNAENGLKVYISREPSYFTYQDTTKKPGCPGLHHRYFALKPALDHARRNNSENYSKLQKEVIKFEGDEGLRITGSIASYFGRRSRDERPGLRVRSIRFR